MMITGDYQHTALGVAKDIGMLEPQDQVVVIDVKSSQSRAYRLSSTQSHALTAADWSNGNIPRHSASSDIFAEHSRSRHCSYAERCAAESKLQHSLADANGGRHSMQAVETGNAHSRQSMSTSAAEPGWSRRNHGTPAAGTDSHCSGPQHVIESSQVLSGVLSTPDNCINPSLLMLDDEYAQLARPRVSFCTPTETEHCHHHSSLMASALETAPGMATQMLSGDQQPPVDPSLAPPGPFADAHLSSLCEHSPQAAGLPLPPADNSQDPSADLSFVLGASCEAMQPSEALKALSEGQMQCALTGDSFDYLLQHCDLSLLEVIMRSAVVFARMKPHQKGQVMDLLGSRGLFQFVDGQQRHVQVTCMA